jgi:hypothetical protein
MSAAENKAVVRRFIDEVWTRGNLAVVDEVLAPTVASHFVERTQGDLTWSPEKEKLWVTATRPMFPDGVFSIDDLIADGDRVAIRTTWRATHRGEFAGIAPTGKRVTATQICIFRMAEGKIVEEWGIFDMHGLLHQIGAGPTSTQATT